MAYGLRIKKADGTTILDSSAGDLITRLRYSNEVSSASSTSLTDTSGHDTVEISYMLGTDYLSIPYQLSRSGTTYSWTDNSVSPWITIQNALIFVFMYT